MPEITPSEWDAILDFYPDAHILQSSSWGHLKAGYGWEPVYIIAGDRPQASGKRDQEFPTGVQVLFRRLPMGQTIAYIPKGPVGRDWEALWPAVDQACHDRQAILLKVEPDLWDPDDIDTVKRVSSPPPGFIVGMQTIQPQRTLLVDLRGDEEQVLGRMRQKTRYNIRLALKKGVVVHASDDIDGFFRLIHLTGGRDQFGVHSQEYYQRAYDLFQPSGACTLLVAEYQEELLAALMVFARGRRAWYFYGASSNDHRDRMPNYLLQWEAMRWARALGCTEYDLWGVPDEDEDALESQFIDREDGLWGVYRFKRGFGGHLCRSAGPWDRVYNPLLYRVYSWWVSRSQRNQG
jgi:lipid II:glycine glycyltransferase (peptidoglycan interpeptide bridge formation enzyme)